MIITSPKTHHFIKEVMLEYSSAKNEVWAIGGAQVAEEGKIVAQHLNKDLIVVPTNLSCDAFWADSYAVRSKDTGPYPLYSKCKSPKKVIFFPYVLNRCQARLLNCGWAEILSSITANITWKPSNNIQLGAQKRMRKMVEKCRPVVDVNSARLLFDLLAEEISIGIRLGSSNFEEGMEHKIAYRLERYTSGLCHSELVFIGINEILNIYNSPYLNLFEDFLRDLKVNLAEMYEHIGFKKIHKVSKLVVKEQRMNIQ